MRTNFTLFFLAVFLIAAWAGWGWPNIAKIMPVYVAAIPGLILVLVQIYREATDWETRRGRSGGMDMDEVQDSQLDKKTELRRTLTYFAWLIGGALGIWLLGIVIALPLLVFLYTLRRGQGEVEHRSDRNRLYLFTHLGTLRIHVGKPMAGRDCFSASKLGERSRLVPSLTRD